MNRFIPRFLRNILQGPEGMLILMACAMAVSLHGWFTLLNNFAVERASFTGKEIGFLQSIREIPGFLSFLAVFLLPFIREQNLAFLSLAMLGIGTAITGYFPSEWTLYSTTFLMSMGFHYYETMNQSMVAGCQMVVKYWQRMMKIDIAFIFNERQRLVRRPLFWMNVCIHWDQCYRFS